jgi:hypothetical protein
MRCSAEGCPKVVQHDCVQWLAEVTSALPSIVLGARDADGNDVLELRVLSDGRLLAEKLDGKALFINPGPHVLRFEPVNRAPFEQTVIVRTGEKNRIVNVTLPRTPGETGSAAPTSDESASSATANRRRTIGFIVGGVGIVALGVGAYFGIRALGKQSDSDKACPNNRCTAEGSDLSQQAVTAAWMSNVGLGLGIVGVGVSAYLLLTSGSSNGAVTGTARSAKWRVLPKAEPHGGGFAVMGHFL